MCFLEQAVSSRILLFYLASKGRFRTNRSNFVHAIPLKMTVPRDSCTYLALHRNRELATLLALTKVKLEVLLS